MTALRGQGAGGENVNKLSNGAPAFRHSRIFTAWRDQTTPNRIPTGASSDAFIVGSAQLEWRGSGSERRGQRKTTQPAASNRLMGLLRRYTRVRIHPNRVLLRPAPMSSSHCFALAKRSCGMRLADTTGSG